MRLNKNWRIDTTGEGCVLIFSEERTRKDGKNEGKVYVFEDQFHYPTIYHCLKTFLDKSMEDAADVKDCIRLIEETYSKINKLQLA
jgi:hypothetical protein